MSKFLLLLAACRSDYGFDTRTPEDPEPDDTSSADDGGWGDWEPGEIPDLVFVLGVLGQDAAVSAEVVVVDLRGQILDRWVPPASSWGTASHIRAIHPAGPGAVWVTVSQTWYQNWRQGPAAAFAPDPVEVWRGDLRAGTWDRVISVEPDSLSEVLSATGEALDPGGEGGGLTLAPGPDPDTFAVARVGPGCTQSASTDLIHVRGGRLAGREPLAAHLTGGIAAFEGGDRWMIAERPDPCLAEGGAPLRVWAVDDGVWSPLGVANPSPWTRFRWHPSLGNALATSVDADPRTGAPVAWYSWVAAEPSRTELPGVVGIRPLAVLDPEHGAFALAELRSGAEGHDLVLYAGGREVWRVDHIRQGLRDRPLTVTEGVLIDG